MLNVFEEPHPLMMKKLLRSEQKGSRHFGRKLRKQVLILCTYALARLKMNWVKASKAKELWREKALQAFYLKLVFPRTMVYYLYVIDTLILELLLY